MKAHFFFIPAVFVLSKKKLWSYLSHFKKGRLISLQELQVVHDFFSTPFHILYLMYLHQTVKNHKVFSGALGKILIKLNYFSFRLEKIFLNISIISLFVHFLWSCYYYYFLVFLHNLILVYFNFSWIIFQNCNFYLCMLIKP